ncbi:MAG: prepilin-type N-terminal cleavage/methylation domain-containing protein [Candidatus Omnitrophota bacterium]|jgi:prepilin-type N-terminal cleavage/methylation domain-containing protein
MRRRGFTILELVVTMVVLCVLAGIALISYQSYIERSRSAEAYVNIDMIKKGEELYKLRTGNYTNAGDADDINTKLFIGIKPRYYEYQVVGASADNFLILAKRIGEDLSSYLYSGAIPADFMLVAMDKSGAVSNAQLFATTGGQIGSGGSTGGAGSWGGVGGTTYWMGGGSGGGSGGTSGGGGLDIPPSTGGGGVTDSWSSTPVVYSAEIQDALNKIANVGTAFYYYSQSGVTLEGDSGNYYFDLIKDKNISVAYAEMASDTLGEWSSGTNSITINQSLKDDPGWPTESIAAIIVHEATHADYFYNTLTWYNRITTLWPQGSGPFFVDPTKLIDPDTGKLYYSITEEYFTNANEAQLWKEYQSDYAGVSGDGIDFENGKVARYDQGEAVVRAYLRAIPAYAALPEFYPQNP